MIAWSTDLWHAEAGTKWYAHYHRSLVPVDMQLMSIDIELHHPEGLDSCQSFSRVHCLRGMHAGWARTKCNNEGCDYAHSNSGNDACV